MLGREGDVLSKNSYIYVQNNPLKYVDPTGEQEEEAGYYEMYYPNSGLLLAGFIDNLEKVFTGGMQFVLGGIYAINNNFTYGMSSQLAELPYSKPADWGSKVGDAISIAIGAVEIITGGAITGGGIAVAPLAAVGGAPTGGLTIVVDGVVIVQGLAIATHGVSVIAYTTGSGGSSSKLGTKKETPKTDKYKFKSINGRKGKQHVDSGEIFEKDPFHKDHYEVYKNLKDYEKSKRYYSTWLDGLIKEIF